MTTDSDAPATWLRSSRCGVEGQCVEVAHDGQYIALRDSKDPHGPIIRYSPVAWTAFQTAVQAGTFDLPN